VYTSGGTIKDALDAIHKHDYVLPAIQREFVWKPQQIERLFDSLMQKYPFGTFLFWQVEPQTAASFQFYDFMREYHERDAVHCAPLGAQPGHPVTAVLDGQQRLTALNIGFRGSMATRTRGGWWANDGSFPKRRLCLDLIAARDPDEDGAVYRFRFMTKAQREAATDAVWYPVNKIVRVEDNTGLHEIVEAFDLNKEQRKLAFNAIARLHNVYHSDQLINAYAERSQDIERVLNIFIRLNSGGTVLSYSDLLLSIAVAQWKQLDARATIHELVDNLNATGRRFAFSQDFVLKAGLMLTDISSVGFKVENFTADNMAKLEIGWPKIEASLRQTVALVDRFGLSGQVLRADSALLPIAYYLHRRSLPDAYLTHSSYAADREAVRGWLVRSLLKSSGIWGSGLDVLLTALRELIRTHGENGFPAAELEREMERRGKSLRFEDAEIDDLLHLSYGDRRMVPLLSLLFPFVDLAHEMHVDHFFPRSRFTAKKLAKIGVGEEAAAWMIEHVDSLPNLQLLEGTANQEKLATLPAAWLAKTKPDAATQADYRDRHLLGAVPDEMMGFKAFFTARREAMRGRLKALLAAN
jgi:Protein of unknown function DUF262